VTFLSSSTGSLRILGTLVAVVGASALAGCGGGTAPVAPDPTGAPPVTSPAPAEPSETPVPAPIQAPEPAPQPAFDRAALSIDDPASLWVVVNKLRPLNPLNFAAGDIVDVPVAEANAARLRAPAANAATAMFAAFNAETGLEMLSQSAYRDYDTQVRVYNGWVTKLGQAEADLTSARPGFSEHQTGLAIDVSALPAVCSLEQCFGATPQGQWLAANAWTYGFVLRFPEGATAITGYEYEPWHFRYVGAELAAHLHETGTATLEEFFGLQAAADYAG
jgi:D-alanyl-D-alanine carboxypeptidase